MILQPDAIITKEVKIPREEKKIGSILLADDIDSDIYHQVIFTGENVKDLQDRILRVKLNLGEMLDIDFVPYAYFSYGPSAYFYIKD